MTALLDTCYSWEFFARPRHFYQPAMPASPNASNYPLDEQWAPLAVYGKKAPLRRKLRGQHKHARKEKHYENEQSKMPNSARAAFVRACGL